MSSGLMEMARGSWWHSTFLKTAGAKIGRGVYFDTLSFSVRPSTLPLSVLWESESVVCSAARMVLLGQ